MAAVPVRLPDILRHGLLFISSFDEDLVQEVPKQSISLKGISS